MSDETKLTVTAIEPQVRRPDRRSVFLDGEFALGADAEVVARAGLRVGQELTLSELRTVMRAEERRAARDAAFRLLGFRDRSGKELARQLERKGYEPDVVAEVVAELSERDFVDDQRFARQWVEGHTGGRPLGPDRLAAELRARGVERETIQEALANIDPESELELALRAGRRLTGGARPADPREARRKLSAALRRRGFSWEVIRGACEQLLGDEESDGLDACES